MLSQLFFKAKKPQKVYFVLEVPPCPVLSCMFLYGSAFLVLASKPVPKEENL